MKTICPDCGKKFKGRYCPDCGRDSETWVSQTRRNETEGERTGGFFKKAGGFFRSHKKLTIVLSIVLVAAIVASVVLGVTLSDNFRYGKLNGIGIGASKSDVERILGKPDRQEASEWRYYSGGYRTLIEKAAAEVPGSVERTALEAEAAAARHDEIRIRFADEKVDAVEMLKDFAEADEIKKTVKSCVISESVPQFTQARAETYARVYYTDGSYRHSRVALSEKPNTEQKGEVPVVFRDEWSDTDVTARLEVVKNPDIFDGRVVGDLSFFIYDNGDGTFRLEIEGSGALSEIPEFAEFADERMKNDLTRVIIGNGVTSIGSYTFLNCGSLTGVEIPLSVASVGDSAFQGCGKRTVIYYESAKQPFLWNENWKGDNAATVKWGYGNITAHAEFDYVEHGDKIYLTRYKGGKQAIVVPEKIEGKTVVGFGEIFREEEITSIVIPDGVTEVDSYAFYNCGALTSAVIGNGVTDIGFSAFSGCGSLESVRIPSGVKSIGADAFYGCAKLSDVEIPSGVTSVGSSAFFGCTSLKSVRIGDGVTNVGSYAFYNCTALTDVKIGSGVKNIGSYAFYECGALTEVEIPEGVNSIGSYAFYNCASLTSVKIGSGVKSIGFSAFSGCAGLTNITYHGTMAQWNSIEKGSDWTSERRTVTCTDGTLGEARTESGSETAAPRA